MSTRVLLAGYSVGLVLSIIASVVFPMTWSQTVAGTISSAALGMGSILIAVEGVLISVYVTQKMKGTEAGRALRLQLIVIVVGMIMSFVSGLVSLRSSTDTNGALLQWEWSLLIAAVYTTVFGVLASLRTTLS